MLNLCLVQQKISKYESGDPVRISKYKYIFAKSCVLNLAEKIFVRKEIENTNGHMLMKIWMVKLSKTLFWARIIRNWTKCL